VTAVASRMVCDVGNWDRTVVIVIPGQSGHPASRHYKDLVPYWATGRYQPLHWSRPRVEADAESRLTLLPADSTLQ